MKKIVFTISLVLLTLMSFGQTLGEEENKVKVYPNPAKSIVSIAIENSTLADAQVTIHSIIGNKMNVSIEPINKGVWRADIDRLPDGFYLVVVKDQQTKFNRTYKFLKGTR